uniref:Uncharacterized protein n=3 Tax=Clastoptera arizonana TaxID=38151 RepID=A0A1B6DYW6_9HEMI
MTNFHMIKIHRQGFILVKFILLYRTSKMRIKLNQLNSNNILLVIFTFLCLVDWAKSQWYDNYDIQCRDENNDPVDWYVIYKLPKLRQSSHKEVKKGGAYAYITSNEERDSWELSSLSIASPKSIPGNTLSQLYKLKDTDEVIYALYNDQPPNVKRNSLSAGHTKGLVVANKDGGFWLVHSVPHFPPDPKKSSYEYPGNAFKNGQSFLCISLPAKDLEVVGTQLMYNNPKVYSNFSAKVLQTLYPNLTMASWGKEIRTAPFQHEVKLTTPSGTEFKSFAKTSKFNKDLYNDWVADSLKVDLIVETWPNGIGRLNSSCQTSYKVENVDAMKIPQVGDDFTSKQDHSKWAIAFEKEKPWVCIGDINRATTQYHRAGGTVCMQNANIWSAYFDSITNIETCPVPKGFFRRTYS